MTGDRLFDVPELPNEDDPALSADQRRTRKRNALLARNINPRTRLPLLEPAGPTCGGCAHHFESRPGQKTFHKCDHGYMDALEHAGKHPAAMPEWELRSYVSHGPATDVRTSWPACTAYQEKKTPPPHDDAPTPLDDDDDDFVVLAPPPSGF